MRILIPILALAAGLGAGILWSPREGKAPAEEAKAPSSERLRAPSNPDSGNEALAKPAVESQEVDLRRELSAAFGRSKVDYRAVKHLMKALSILSTESLPEFAAFLREQPMKRGQVFLWQMAFSAWAELDPQGALAFIEERFKDPGSRRLYYASVVETWGASSPDDALAAALEKFKPQDLPPGSEFAIEYLKEIAAKDPDTAIQLATRLRDGEILFDLAARKISRMGKQNWDTALEALGNLEGPMHTHAAGQLVSDWAAEEPSKAAAWLKENYVPEMGDHTLVQVASQYLSSSPAAALAWIESMAEGKTRDRMLSESVLVWAREEPRAAANWVETLEPQANHDAAVVALGHALAADQPRAVIEDWVPRIADAQRGNELLYQVSMEWQRDKPEAYAQWLSTTSALSEETRQRLRAREVPGPGVPGLSVSRPLPDAGRTDPVPSQDGRD